MHVALTGVLTQADNKTHTGHLFELPSGTHGLEIVLSATGEFPGQLKPMLCLSLFGPEGFRGAGHRSALPQRVLLGEAEATPGYLPGPLPPGAWVVVIDAHRIMPGMECAYRIDIQATAGGSGGHEARPDHPQRRASPPRTTSGPAWYRGDLHCHSNHSDGSWSLEQAWAYAAAVGLDFTAATDHNTVSQLEELDRQERTPLLVIKGMELTTFRGHALSLGTRQWIDWRVRPGARDMPAILEEVDRAGGLFVIAHPCSHGDPSCTGCDWRYEEMMPGEARAVEVWNSPWGSASNNEQNVRLWYDWLNAGKHIVATAGTDMHRAFGPGDHRFGFNVVHAEDCTEDAILRAVSRGRLYLSAGPTLHLVAASGARSAGMGETLPADRADLEVSWESCPEGSLLALIADGERRAELRIGDRGRHVFACSRAAWCLIEVRHPDGGLIALTNPVFLEPAGVR